MKKFKGLIGTLLIGISLLSLTGCASKEDKLIKALEKTSTIKSLSYKANADFKFSGQSAQEMGGFSGFNLELTGKSVTEGKTLAKSQANIKVGVMGVSTDLDLIQQISLDKNNTDIKMLLEVPEMLKAQAGSMFQNTDYIYIDSKGLDKLQQMEKAQNPDAKTSENIDINKIGANAGNIQKSSFLFLKDYTKKDGKELIKYTGKNPVTINGAEEKLETYEIKLNNEGLKKLLKAYVKDEKRVKELQDYFTALAPEGSKENEKINVEELNKEIDKMEDIFGKNGLLISFAVKDGYIVQQKISANLISNKDDINFNLSYDIFDINKNIEIVFPNKEDVKSIDLVDLMSMFNGAIKAPLTEGL
ncbi:hypothetical protein JOC70_000906 [Clostridium pascui]|uniref:hypothetical protein n=1 Tax=Clostridium pascui TaxID=46609 RepID=UPI0019563C9B|nr:hypothetical protein [Clostridium pascui]MBM7869437.1 hypothetical protein [Clostridium pascui]